MKRSISKPAVALFATWMLIAPFGVFARRHSKSPDEAGKTDQAAKKDKREKAHKPKPKSTDVFYPTPP